MRDKPLYEEYLAHIILLNLMSCRFFEIEIGDRPDLIGTGRNGEKIGVEITKYISSEYEKFRHSLSKCLNKEIGYKKSLNQLRKIVGDFDISEHVIKILLGEDIKPEQMTIEQICRLEPYIGSHSPYMHRGKRYTIYDAIKNKSMKVKDYMKEHPELTEMDLFIKTDKYFSHEHTSEELNAIKNYITTECANIFKFVYVMSINKILFIVDVNNDTLSELQCSEQLLSMYEYLAGERIIERRLCRDGTIIKIIGNEIDCEKHEKYDIFNNKLQHYSNKEYKIILEDIKNNEEAIEYLIVQHGGEWK